MMNDSTKMTWGDVFNIFKNKHRNIVDDILDYRPYATMTIQIWLKDGLQIIYNASDDSMNYILPDHTCKVVNGRSKSERTVMLLYFPKNLKCELVRVGMTANDLSKAIGVHRSTVGRYLNGERLPSDDVIEEMAKVLGCDVYDLTKKE